MTKYEDLRRLEKEFQDAVSRGFLSPIHRANLTRATSQVFANELRTYPSNFDVREDASAKLGIYGPDGTEVAYLDSNGYLVWKGSGTAPTSAPTIGASAGYMELGVATGKGFVFQTAGAGGFQVTNHLINQYQNIATAGTGVAVIYKSSIQSQSNAAPTTVSYTPPATAGTYRISANLEITTATIITFKNKLTYTSASGAATTDRPIWERQGSATILAEPTANTADRFVMEPYQFTIDNSGGAIALADDAGTYTTCAYRLGVLLEQLT